MSIGKRHIPSAATAILLACLWLLASPPLRANLQYECLLPMILIMQTTSGCPYI